MEVVLTSRGFIFCNPVSDGSSIFGEPRKIHVRSVFDVSKNQLLLYLTVNMLLRNWAAILIVVSVNNIKFILFIALFQPKFDQTLIRLLEY